MSSNRPSQEKESDRGRIPVDFLRVGAPEAPDGYETFWQARYRRALAVDPDPAVRDTETTKWLSRIRPVVLVDGRRASRRLDAVPLSGVVRHGLVVLHGYGGRTEPDWDLPFPDAVMIFPCARGLGMRSLLPDVPSGAYQHVLHGIESGDR